MGIISMLHSKVINRVIRTVLFSHDIVRIYCDRHQAKKLEKINEML